MNARFLGSPRVATPEGMAAMKGRVYRVSNARARSDLGWEPTVPLRDSMKDMMEAIRALRRSEGKARMA